MCLPLVSGLKENCGLNNNNISIGLNSGSPIYSNKLCQLCFLFLFNSSSDFRAVLWWGYIDYGCCLWKSYTKIAIDIILGQYWLLSSAEHNDNYGFSILRSNTRTRWASPGIIEWDHGSHGKCISCYSRLLYFFRCQHQLAISLFLPPG